MTPRRKSRESGFALLLVFAMAAIVAMMMYLELPRVAFEAQRAKEELLIARGEQYRRAIQLYMRKAGRYPPTIEALENTNNTRFLRRRYKDPMTGKDEWRLIHVGPGGVLTDSLTMKLDQAKQGAGQLGGQFGTSMGTSIGSQMGTPLGAGPSSAGSAVNPDAGPGAQPVPSFVPPRRPSDMRRPPGAMAGAEGDQQPAPAAAQGQAAQYPPGAPAQPGVLTPLGRQAQPGQPPLPGQVLPGQQPAQPQMGYQMGQPVQNAAENPYQGPGRNPGDQPGAQYQQQAQPGTGMNPGLTSSPYQPGGFSPGPQTGPQGSQAGVGIIENQVRSPRPQAGFSFGGTVTIGGGIAGVASTLEATGIKIYGDRTKYNEWEFIYDPRKDPRLIGMGQVGPATGIRPGSSTGTNPTGTQPKP